MYFTVFLYTFLNVGFALTQEQTKLLESAKITLVKVSLESNSEQKLRNFIQKITDKQAEITVLKKYQKEILTSLKNYTQLLITLKPTNNIIAKILEENFTPLIHNVTDGDTVSYIDSDGFLKKIRLIGIDAPENSRTRYGKIEFYSKESSEYLEKLVL
jgi:PHD/YefM family antitoxin component YafN of YafNO toxin-antitoxin module